MGNGFKAVWAAALLGLAIMSIRPAAAQTNMVLRLGILGDSGQDEYQGTDNRGGDFHSVSFNWVEQLVNGGRVDVGPWGEYDEPRRTGYAYNWSRTGATSDDLIEAGQHTGLAEQIKDGRIDVVAIVIGGNNFAPYRANGYGPVYGGEVVGDELQAKIDNVVNDITEAVDTLQAAGDVPIILSTLPNLSVTPMVLNEARFNDPEKRQRVTDAINAVNAGLADMVAARKNITLVDPNQIYLNLLDQMQDGQLLIGDEAINMLGVGDDPHNGILGDGIHGGTILEGLLANFCVDAINSVTDANLTPLSNDEILAAAGLGTNGIAANIVINQPPTAGDDAFSTKKGQPLTVTPDELFANDSDPDGDTLNLIAATLPEHGTLTPGDDGAGIYTPDAGFTGVDTMTYTIDDGKGGTATATITITVNK